MRALPGAGDERPGPARSREHSDAYAIQQLLDGGVRIYTYFDDREITMNSPTDTFLVQVQAFVASLEREKARQRTYDAMLRKAKAGHVTGGLGDEHAPCRARSRHRQS